MELGGSYWGLALFSTLRELLWNQIKNQALVSKGFWSGNPQDTAALEAACRAAGDGGWNVILDIKSQQTWEGFAVVGGRVLVLSGENLLDKFICSHILELLLGCSCQFELSSAFLGKDFFQGHVCICSCAEETLELNGFALVWLRVALSTAFCA